MEQRRAGLRGLARRLLRRLLPAAAGQRHVHRRARLRRRAARPARRRASAMTVAEMATLLRPPGRPAARAADAAQALDRRLAEGFLEIQQWEFASGHFHRAQPQLLHRRSHLRRHGPVPAALRAAGAARRGGDRAPGGHPGVAGAGAGERARGAAAVDRARHRRVRRRARVPCSARASTSSRPRSMASTERACVARPRRRGRAVAAVPALPGRRAAPASASTTMPAARRPSTCCCARATLLDRDAAAIEAYALEQARRGRGVPGRARGGLWRALVAGGAGRDWPTTHVHRRALLRALRRDLGRGAPRGRASARLLTWPDYPIALRAAAGLGARRPRRTSTSCPTARPAPFDDVRAGAVSGRRRSSRRWTRPSRSAVCAPPTTA